MTRLSIAGLEKRFDKTHAVRGITLEVDEGELVSLLGKSVGELREEKTDRRALVALFGELALRLNGDASSSAS